MLAAALDGYREVKRIFARDADRLERHHLRFADRQRARLVEGDHGYPLRQFERFRVLDEHAVPGGDARAHHDGGRRSQAERAGTRDHEHRYGVENRGLRRCAGEQPQPERRGGDREDGRHEDGADPIDQSLNRGFFSLRAFDEPDDAGKRRFRARGGRGDLQQTFAVDRSGRDALARAFRDGQALAGHERFVDVRAACGDRSVDGHALTGLHDHHHAHPHLSERDVALVARGVLDVGAVGAQRVERADRVRRFALGAGFEPLAQPD